MYSIDRDVCVVQRLIRQSWSEAWLQGTHCFCHYHAHCKSKAFLCIIKLVISQIYVLPNNHKLINFYIE